MSLSASFPTRKKSDFSFCQVGCSNVQVKRQKSFSPLPLTTQIERATMHKRGGPTGCRVLMFGEESVGSAPPKSDLFVPILVHRNSTLENYRRVEG